MRPEDFLACYTHKGLEAETNRHIHRDIRRFATRPDGSIDKNLAGHIELEELRRLNMGRELDEDEPERWTLEKIPLTIAAATAVKHFTAPPVGPALSLLCLTSAIPSVIELARIPTRFEAGLAGGCQTALQMAALERKGETPAFSKNLAPRPSGWSETVAGPAPAVTLGR